MKKQQLIERIESLLEAPAKRTNAFVFTHTPGDERSEKKLAALKDAVKGSDLRVSMMGRLGKNNPDAKDYRPSGPKRNSNTIAVKSAKKFDVYVHDKTHSNAYKVEKGSKYDSESRAGHIDLLVRRAKAGKDIYDHAKLVSMFTPGTTPNDVIKRVKGKIAAEKISKMKEDGDDKLDESTNTNQQLIRRISSMLSETSRGKRN